MSLVIATGSFHGHDVIGTLDEDNKVLKNVFKIVDVIVDANGGVMPQVQFFRSLAFVFGGNFKDREIINLNLDNVDFVKTTDQIKITQPDLAKQLETSYLGLAHMEDPVKKHQPQKKESSLIGL